MKISRDNEEKIKLAQKLEDLADNNELLVEGLRKAFYQIEDFELGGLVDKIEIYDKLDDFDKKHVESLREFSKKIKENNQTFQDIDDGFRSEL